jgi:ABC-type Fe2+-enterobactin transport system substrate-binding protein
VATPSPALAGLVSERGGGRRAFVDATGTSVALPSALRRLAVTSDDVGALLLALDAPVVGCAGRLDGIEQVGASRRPDPAAVAALRPDLIVVGAVDRVPDLADPALIDALRRIAPVVAVDMGRPTAARADLRALLGSAAPPPATAAPAVPAGPSESEPPSAPVPPPGPPVTRPELG